MELLFELLLTAAATLLVAVLLAKLFSGNNDPPRRDRAAGPADVIAEEKAEEERVIEVDEVEAEAAWADVAAPSLAEGWVEVEKAPATVAEGRTEWVAAEEGVPATLLAPELFLGAVSQEQKEEGEVGKKQPDLTAATEAAVEAKPRDSGAESSHGEVLCVELEEETGHQHDLGAEVAPSEVPVAGLQKQEVQATEAVGVKQLHLDVGAAAAEVTDAGLEEEEEGAQAAEVIPRELASDTLPADVLDAVPGKQEEQVIEANQHESAPVAAPRVIPDAAAKDEEMKQESVEEVVVPHEEVQNKEEAQCEAGTVDQQEKLVSKEELALKKSDDLNVSQEVVPNDKVVVQLPEEETTLLGMPEDEARASMEFEEWEGIERSEVEKRFGAAAAFAASDTGTAALSKLNSDVQLQLQGLLKVAVDGPCYDAAQPLTLRPSSRAKWVSWQKLGNMHPEIAMEKYMNLLSEFVPGWMGDKTSSTEKREVDVDSEGALLTMTAHTSDPQINQGNEGSTSIDEGPLTNPPNPEKGQSSDIPAE
ncbi:acyl-CoA-binding domain-containing protein 5-like isoform X1 [Hordeum vulgare subsp. vulgare]|uniref:ACB domain-containing protein n=1 Tax=Hordeum vulgare subsp. vulgare TaxID=112509 RepID=A0A8I6XJC7_HORVV|nr:acyl-CoA-binding domain-containing protein 5-like isoform X1 [Hordeum vulgare subsp. vulgare]